MATLSKDNYIITKKNPTVKYYIIALILVLMLIAYLLGARNSLSAIMSSKTKIHILKTELVATKNINSQLRQRNAEILNENHIFKLSEKKLMNINHDKQEEIYDLKKEVSLYQSIMSAANTRSTLNIAQFELNKTLDNNRFQYKLTLSHQDRKHRLIRGSVSGLVKGVNKIGQITELSIGDVIVSKNSQLNYKFRYYQVLDGEIILPEGFKPEAVHLQIVNNDGAKIANKQYQWIVEEPSNV